MKTETLFYYCLVSSQGGHELFNLFCRIWSGYHEDYAHKALQYFCTGRLAIDGLKIREDLIVPFMESDSYQDTVFPWFQGITCDGERAARAIYVLLTSFNHFCCDPHYYGVPM